MSLKKFLFVALATVLSSFNAYSENDAQVNSTKKSASDISVPLMSTGHIDPKELVDTLSKCTLVTDLLGGNIKVSRMRTIGTAGVWFPPVSGCKYSAFVQGDKKGTSLYFSLNSDDTSCYHLSTHSGKMRQNEGGVSRYFQYYRCAGLF